MARVIDFMEGVCTILMLAVCSAGLVFALLTPLWYHLGVFPL